MNKKIEIDKKKIVKEQIKYVLRLMKLAKESGYKRAIQDVLDYVGKRGFRECNYEMNETIKWLIKQNEKKYNGNKPNKPSKSKKA